MYGICVFCENEYKSRNFEIYKEPSLFPEVIQKVVDGVWKGNKSVLMIVVENTNFFDVDNM